MALSRLIRLVWGRGLVKTDRNNLAPRFGIAWRVTDKTVLRGGYGVFYPTSSAQGIRDALGSAPFNHGLTKTATAALPLGGWPGGLTPPGVTPLTGGRLNFIDSRPEANSIPFDLQQPRIEQFNATFEHELGWQTGVRVSLHGHADARTHRWNRHKHVTSERCAIRNSWLR